jgi:Protein of unknown function (DUF2550)
MLIALLAILGVNLIVIVVLLAVVLSRKRWVRRQPGAFRGVIRVASGEIDGLRPKWGRGYGRWVRDVLVWTKAPFFFRNELVAADGMDQQRPAGPDEVKRLGDHPVIVQLTTGGAALEVAAHDADSARLPGPYGESSAVGPHQSAAPNGARADADRTPL